jgi:LPXTG-site transpeptidase (sortase) family protein
MHEKPLLLPAANESFLHRESYLRLAVLLVGGLVVLIGAASLAARAAHAVFGTDASRQIFAPAAASAETVQTPAAEALVPVRLKIPSIGVNALVEQVGQKDDGTMGTPTKFGDVAWYAPGAKPGAQTGSAVFAGHVDNALTTAGVFEHLADVKAGDYVTVEDAQGKSVVYRVTSTHSYPANEAPLAQIFATAGPAQLVLITCAGTWVTSEHQFDQRLVVTANPAY